MYPKAMLQIRLKLTAWLLTLHYQFMMYNEWKWHIAYFFIANIFI